MDSGFDLATTESLADRQDPLLVVLVDMYQRKQELKQMGAPTRL